MEMTVEEIFQKDPNTFYIIKDQAREYITVFHLFDNHYKVRFYNAFNKMVIDFAADKDFKLRVQK